MTRKQWYADEQNLAGLREALANPYIQRALAVIATESRPNYKATQNLASARNASDTASALSVIHSMQAGMNNALDILDELQRMPPDPKTSERAKAANAAPFDHIGNEPTTQTANT